MEEECMMLINGEWIKSENTMKSINPATEEPIGTVYCADQEMVEEAVNAAINAFPKWSELSLWRRARYVKEIASLMKEKAEEIQKLITTEMGRPLKESRTEVSETSGMTNLIGEEGKAYLAGETLPIDSSIYPNKFALTIREPIGVVGVIKPWNFPLQLSIWAIAPALLTGNTVVYKPSELTPFVGAEIGKLAQEAKLPPGVLNIVHGDGAVGAMLVESNVDMIAFTGSAEAGKKIMQNSANKLHKLSLELGGSDPFIVLPTADLEEAVNAAAWGRFTNCGQVCTSPKRIIVLEEIADDFIEKLTKKASKIKVGNGMDPATDMGPLVSSKQRQKIITQVDDAKKLGATIKLGGKIPPNLKKGYYYEPTIITNTNDKMKVVNEEVFGPVATIITAKTTEEAVGIANCTPYGLGASIWTENLNDAVSLMQKVKAGMIWINEINTAYANCPWGGIKNSGMGKELGREGVIEFTTLKQINLDYSKNNTRKWWYQY
jgi:acyl-CoA reductase-like NAD-dependent aldehyde dehydrogenase